MPSSFSKESRLHFQRQAKLGEELMISFNEEEISKERELLKSKQ